MAGESWRVRPATVRQAYAEAALLGLILLAALLLRLPYLVEIPAFTDETTESARGVAIARGQMLPLTNHGAYIGPLKNYLDAAGFLLLGNEPGVPRLVSLAAAVLTVAGAYLLGREWGGWRVGTLAALLLATSSLHVVVNSHVGWSNCVTPLFTTFSLAALVRAERRRQAPLLPLSAALLAAAVQTHPSAILLLPAMLAALLLSPGGRALLRSRWAALASLAGLAVYSPVITYALISGLHPLRSMLSMRANYARTSPVDLAEYPRNLTALAAALARAATGQIAEPAAEDRLAALLWPAAALVLLTILALCWRRGVRLPLLAALAVCLPMPLLTTRVALLFNGRYEAPLLPLIFAALGMALLGSGPRPSAEAAPAPPDRPLPRLRAFAPPVLAALLALGISAASLWSLHQYYERSQGQAERNQRLLALYELLRVEGRSGSWPEALLDADMRRNRSPGGGDTVRSLLYLCALAMVRCRETPVDPPTVVTLLGESPSIPLLIVRRRHAEAIERETALQLDVVGERPRHPDLYALYRVRLPTTAEGGAGG